LCWRHRGTAAQRHGDADLRQDAPAAPAEAPHLEPSHLDPITRGHGQGIAMAWGRARLDGGEQSRGRQTEARDTNPHGQKRGREEAVRLPHTAAVETAGVHQNRAATSTAMHGRQRARGD
jgi:hypothetical protein